MLTKIKARNFLSWAELSYDIATGVTLVDGWNEDDHTSEGSGKSALFNAISWGLFGKLPKDANIDDVIRNGEKGCAVTLEFSDGSQVTRQRNPNDLWLIDPNGKKLKGKDARETQQMIVDWLGLSFETFCQTVYFAQNYENKFITANQADKAKILSEVQQLKVFDAARQHTLELAKVAETELATIESNILIQQKQIELAQKDVDSAKVAIETAKNQRVVELQLAAKAIESAEVKIQNEKAQKVSKIKQIETEVSLEKQSFLNLAEAKQNRLNQFDAEIQVLQTEKLVNANKLDELRSEYNLILVPNVDRDREQAELIQLEIYEKQGQIQLIDKANAERKRLQDKGVKLGEKYKTIEAKIAKIRAFIENPGESKCPTCNTILGAGDTTHAKAELATLEAEFADVVAELTEIAKECESPIPSAQELVDFIENLKKIMASHKEKITEATNIDLQRQSFNLQVKQAETNLQQLDSKISKVLQDRGTLLGLPVPTTSDKLQNLEKQLNLLIASLDFVDTVELDKAKADYQALEAKPLNYDPERLPKAELALQNTFASLAAIQVQKETKRLYLGRLETLKQGWKEVKAHVFNSLLNEINARVKMYVDRLFEVPVKVQFLNEDMQISTVVEIDGQSRGLGLLSGGQFRRVAIACDLALADIILARKGSKIGITIFDECFKGLSEPSLERVLELLKNRKEPTLMVEHNSIFHQFVQNSIKVVLVDGVSHFE